MFYASQTKKFIKKYLKQRNTVLLSNVVQVRHVTDPTSAERLVGEHVALIVIGRVVAGHLGQIDRQVDLLVHRSVGKRLVHDGEVRVRQRLLASALVLLRLELEHRRIEVHLRIHVLDQILNVGSLQIRPLLRLGLLPQQVDLLLQLVGQIGQNSVGARVADRLDVQLFDRIFNVRGVCEERGFSLILRVHFEIHTEIH